MSLYGALFSGVSGLVAQSSAMGAISDNITNVSTIGYKNTAVSFQTLVTKQTSSTFYSAGGVQSKPLQATDVQGLLQASTSQSDISISGSGFFVVNEASVPTISNQFLYTRAGGFTQDNDGFLKNTAGFYLQGWPVTAAGVVKPANTNLTIANQNIISTDYLSTVNLSRVGGTATATTTIGIGANLPSNDTTGVTHKTDVQFFDTLGNANTISFVYTKTGRENQWDVSVDPPSGTSALTIEDSSGNAYQSGGHLEFTTRPADGASVVIDGKTYEFDSNASVTAPVAQTRTITVGGVAAGGNVTATINGTAIVAAIGAADALTLAASKIANAINSNATVNGVVAATANGTAVTITSRTAGTAFTMAATTDTDATLTTADAAGTANAGTAGTYQVDISTSTTAATDVAALVAAVIAADSDFDSTNNRIKVSPGSTTTVLFTEDGTGAITVNPTALRDTSGDPVTKQESSFNVRETNTLYRDYQQFTFSDRPADASTIVVNGTTYTFTRAGETAGDNDTTIDASGDLPSTLADLEAAIEANDAQFSGTKVRVRANGNDAGFNNTLVIEAIPSGTFNTVFQATLAVNITEPDGTAVHTSGGAAATVAVNKNNAVIFGSDGLPTAFNVKELEILSYANGAADMDDAAANSPQMTLDFGTVDEANGMTQFGSEFTPVFITQNGSRFGTFAGVTISTDGLVTALFDNGEIRHIYKLPMATFVNPNELGGRSGNVWNATQASGDYTLREADNGPAGQVTQSALEASTVDIGSEFTNMIVVQRAYSASTKIISTADEMLEELMRTKR